MMKSATFEIGEPSRCESWKTYGGYVYSHVLYMMKIVVMDIGSRCLKTFMVLLNGVLLCISMVADI